MKRIFIYLFVSYYFHILFNVRDNSYNLASAQNGVKGGSKGGSSLSKTSNFSKSSVLTPSAISRLQTNKFQSNSVVQQVSEQQQEVTQIGQFTQTQLAVPPAPPPPQQIIESTFTKVEDSSSSVQQQSDSEPTIYGAVAGVPNVDFPGYTTIPNSKFSCEGRAYEIGMYADEETGCQVYHLCYRGRKESFLCGIGTIFNQAILGCDYWHSVRCSDSSRYYSVNSDLGKSSSEPASGGGVSSSFSKTVQEAKILRPVQPPIKSLLSSSTIKQTNNQVQQKRPSDSFSSFQSEFSSSKQAKESVKGFGGKTSIRQEKSSTSLLSPSHAALRLQSERSSVSSTRSISDSAGLIPVGARLQVSSSLGYDGADRDIDVQGAASESESSRMLDDGGNKLEPFLRQSIEQKPATRISSDDEWKPYVRSAKGSSSRKYQTIDKQNSETEFTPNKTSPSADNNQINQYNRTNDQSKTSYIHHRPGNTLASAPESASTNKSVDTTTTTTTSASTITTPAPAPASGDKHLEGDKLEVPSEEVTVSKSGAPPYHNMSVNPIKYNPSSLDADDSGSGEAKVVFTTSSTPSNVFETTKDDNTSNPIRLSTSVAILADEETTIASVTSSNRNNLTTITPNIRQSPSFTSKGIDLQKSQ